MPTEKKQGSIKTSTDYENVTSADRHQIPARGGKSGKLSDGARAHPCWPPFFRRLSDGFGIYFAIYPKDNFSCLASFEQKHIVPVSTVLLTTD